MNKACLRCNNTMLVPDIPLPKSYTQKCTNCGFDNPVGDDMFFDKNEQFETVMQDGPIQLGADDDELDSLTFDSGDQDIDLTGGINKDNADDFLKQLETRVAPPVQPRQSSPQLPHSSSAANQNVTRPAPSYSPPPASPSPQLVESLKKSMQAEFDAKLELMEKKMMAVMASVPQTPIPTNLESTGSHSLQSITQEVVAIGEALLCTQNASLARASEVALRQAGFSLVAANTLEEAKSKIQEYAFQVIIFDYRFIQAVQDGKVLLNHIQHIALPIRRHQCVVLITPGLPTCESQVFYQMGVDLNINPDDLSDLGNLVGELVRVKADLLRPYLESPMDTDRILV